MSAPCGGSGMLLRSKALTRAKAPGPMQALTGGKGEALNSNKKVYHPLVNAPLLPSLSHLPLFPPLRTLKLLLTCGVLPPPLLASLISHPLTCPTLSCCALLMRTHISPPGYPTKPAMMMYGCTAFPPPHDDVRVYCIPTTP